MPAKQCIDYVNKFDDIFWLLVFFEGLQIIEQANLTYVDSNNNFKFFVFSLCALQGLLSQFWFYSICQICAFQQCERWVVGLNNEEYGNLYVYAS